MGRYRWLRDAAVVAQQLRSGPDHVQPDVFAYPDKALDQAARRSRGKKVCVLGAGIAGLATAYELATRPGQAGGHEVVLVESTHRVGGRIRTWHVSGASGEFGPMRIPRNHGGTLHYAQKLKLRLGLFVQRNPNAFYNLGGNKRRLGAWSDLGNTYLAARSGSHLSKSVDLLAPSAHAALDRVLGKAVGSLLEGDTWQLLTEPLGLGARALAAISLREFVREVEIKVRTPSGRQPDTRLLPRAQLTEAEWQAIGRMTGYLWEETAGALEGFVEEAGILGGDERWRLLDGMDALPLALLADLRNRCGVSIRMASAVTRVEKSGNGGYRVFTSHGEIETSDQTPFDYIVCAVPPSATTRIDFEPRLDPLKVEALSALSYQSAAKTLVHVDKRRWEMGANPIFGGASYTDAITQQCWYPSDNVRAIHHVPDDGTESVVLEVEPAGLAFSKEPLFSAITYVDGDSTGGSRAGILTGAYMTGTNAERFTSLSQSERDAAVLAALSELHPGIRDDVVDIQHWSWIEQNTPGGGAWVCFRPGDHERYQDALCTPHPGQNRPGVFFAGEHLCVMHGWMQSAIQSALEAVLGVLDAS